MIDARTLKASQDFKELPDHYVIFVTREDIFGLGKLLYTIQRRIDGTQLPFEDGSHIIYINTSAKEDGSELWKLAHDLRCTEADEMFFPFLAERVRFFKQTEEGMQAMSDVFESVRREAAEKAAKKAAKQEKESLVRGLLALGKLTLEEVAACSGLTIGEVQALERKMA